MSKEDNKETGLTSYLVVFMLVVIVALFGWISERDYEYQREIGELHQALAAVDSECGPTIELSMPVDLGTIQL